jgi:predicted phage replisome organizer
MFDISRKIKQIERMPQGDTILIIWFKLLTLAGKINDGGAIYITKKFPYDMESLADELRRNEDITQKALSTLEMFDMIECVDGFIYISSWEEYQNIEGMEKLREQNRERKRLQRARQKQALIDDVSRDSHVTVTGCHDTEEEEEKDKEKEFHSFIHSSACEDDYVKKKVIEEGFEPGTKDAEVYAKEIKEGLKLRYIGGELGQGVIFMSDEQYEDLYARYSADEIEKYFGIIVECERSGKKYKKKSHYQAVIEMAETDRRIT